MNKEEATLSLLEQMDGRNTKITRCATNTLLDWAEQAQVEVKILLYKISSAKAL